MSQEGDDHLESKPFIDVEAPAATIHVVDNDPDWLLFLFEYLTNVGFHVAASSNLNDALDLLAGSHAEVLIADQGSLGLTEIELLDRVKSVSPATRLILTSAGSQHLPGLRWFRSGGVDLLVKPIDWTMLMRAVERATGKDRVGRLVN